MPVSGNLLRTGTTKDDALGQSESSEPVAPQPTSPRAWIGYVIPMVVYTAFTFLESQPLGISYPFMYTLKAVVTAITLYMSRKLWKEIAWDSKMVLPGLGVGLLVFLEWIIVDPHTRHFLGQRTAYNPFHEISQPGIRAMFLMVRFTGLVLIVPVMEELFWRSFLIRWFTDPDFKNVSMTGWSWSAFGMVAGIFALSHPEWLAALICAAAYGLLLRKTGSLFACVEAHASTNLILGLYILRVHAYQYW